MSVCNGEQFLRVAVDSILAQTSDDFEFIIINDGSTDSTREILESYNDERLVLVHQDNMGLTKSLNKGIALAKGRYIARQDADDVSKPDRLEKQVAYMEANPDIGLLGSRFEFIDEAGNVLRQSMLPTDEAVLRERLPLINQFCHASVMIRREALEKVGGYREFFRYAQDYDLWLRIAENYGIANLPDFLVQYRELEDAISSSKILLQSRYAWAAAECARQRRNGGEDDLQRGQTPELPHVKKFSDNLQRKLTTHYSLRPEEMLAGLRSDEEREDVEYLFVRLCEEKVELEDGISSRDALIRQKDQQLHQRDELVRNKDEQLRQKDELIRNRDEQLRQKDELIRNRDEQLRQKDELIRQKCEEVDALLQSASWRLTAPVRAVHSILKKKD